MTGLSATQRARDLLIRRFQRGRPAAFRSVRDLRCVAVSCPVASGESRSRSSPWLPAWLLFMLDAWHLVALVLVVIDVSARTVQGMARVWSGGLQVGP
jgi:hypothetical protein